MLTHASVKLKAQAKVKAQAKLKPQAKTPAAPPGPPPSRPRPQDVVAPVPPKKPPPLRQSVEACFSDNNLKTDRDMREIILADPEGWVDVDDVLELKRVRAYRATREELIPVLQDSPTLELWYDPVDGSARVRRRDLDPKSLPAFEGRAMLGLRRPRKPVVEEPDDEEEDAPQAVDDDDEDVALVKDGRTPAKRKRCPNAEVKPGARFVGRIKSFHSTVGMGFVECRPTFEVYGRDLALDKENMKSFLVGECVAFGLAVDADFGTPKAVELEAANEADIDFCVQEAPAPEPAARRPPAKAQKPGAPKAGAQPAASPGGAPAAPLASMRFIGRILQIDEATGMGKIACPETFAALGRHVQVSQEEYAGFDTGDRVSFALRAAKAVELEAE